MKRWSLRTTLQTAALASLVAIAACAPKATPPKVATPAPAPVVIPPRPTPPNGAAPNFVLPPLGADGLRVSVNRNISPAQAIWNLRSAYNVAALNCPAADYPTILPGYREFLRVHARGLTAANTKVDAEFRARHGARFIPHREKYMTEVYNHFAFPPTIRDFCDAVSAVARDAKPVKPAELEAFSQRSLPNVEVVFDDFFRRYDSYLAELGAWNAKYGGLVAVAVPPVPAGAPAQP